MGGGNITPVAQVKEASLTTERNLFEYIAQQSLANSLGGTSSLANPSTLATQVSRHLRGFMERANHQTGISERKGRAMSPDEGSQTVKADQAEMAQRHAGPAREQLTPSEAGAQRTEAVDSVSDHDFDNIIDALTRSMQFMLESNALVTGSSNVVKSMQTLMRGQ